MELLPCPFCGGKAEFERMGNHRQSCQVGCMNCGCSHESSDEGEDSGQSWNRRDSESFVREQIECLTIDSNDAHSALRRTSAALETLRVATAKLCDALPKIPFNLNTYGARDELLAVRALLVGRTTIAPSSLPADGEQG